MLKLQLLDKLESTQQQLKITEDDILKLSRIIDGLKEQQDQLLSKRSDLIWRIEDLKDVIAEEEENND